MGATRSWKPDLPRRSTEYTRTGSDRNCRDRQAACQPRREWTSYGCRTNQRSDATYSRSDERYSRVAVCAHVVEWTSHQDQRGRLTRVPSTLNSPAVRGLIRAFPLEHLEPRISSRIRSEPFLALGSTQRESREIYSQNFIPRSRPAQKYTAIEG